uniref:Uncharacterized protein n=1 Tax=Anopheles christyi TaxID=43041 RepID=A0A240PK12_9DIPT
MCRSYITLALLVSTLATLTIGQAPSDDPFEDETNQCQINVHPEMMKSLANSMQAEVTCDDLWNNLLLQLHRTRQNLTDCRERAASVPTPDPSDTFCQMLLDDAQRQMEQEHNRYAATMEEKLHAAQQATQQQQDAKGALQKQLDSLQDARNELYLDLLLANIAIGETKQALSYYALQPAKLPTEKLHEQIVRSVYRVTLYQDQRLINLITFVRGIRKVEERRSLYQLTQREIQKRPSQRDGYVAAIFALNVREDLPVYQTNQRLYSDLAGPLEQRWKEQLANGNYKEVTEFATRQPKYFQQMQTSLATVDQNRWVNLKFDKFVPYVNALPQPAQRLEVLRQLLKQIRERNANNSHNHLVQTARQFDICEQFINKGKVDQTVKKTLDELRGQFGAFSKGKDYKYYLAESMKQVG